MNIKKYNCQLGSYREESSKFFFCKQYFELFIKRSLTQIDWIIEVINFLRSIDEEERDKDVFFHFDKVHVALSTQEIEQIQTSL